MEMTVFLRGPMVVVGVIRLAISRVRCSLRDSPEHALVDDRRILLLGIASLEVV